MLPQAAKGSTPTQVSFCMKDDGSGSNSIIASKNICSGHCSLSNWL